MLSLICNRASICKQSVKALMGISTEIYSDKIDINFIDVNAKSLWPFSTFVNQVLKFYSHFACSERLRKFPIKYGDLYICGRNLRKLPVQYWHRNHCCICFLPRHVRPQLRMSTCVDSGINVGKANYFNDIWASSWDYCTYHMGDQRRPRRAYASVQSRQSRWSHMWSIAVDEGSEQKNQTPMPPAPPPRPGWLRMRVWRMSLRRLKSVIISWDGTYGTNKSSL